MKYLIYFAALFFLGSSCQDAKKANKDPLDTITSKKEDITLEVTPTIFGRDQLAEITIAYIVKNNSSYPIQYGSHFKIERQIDTRWEGVPFIDNLVFEDILYRLKPDSSQKLFMAIPKILKNKPVETGSYRITKEIWPENRNHEKSTLMEEFTIE